jgi:hypothetical protein
VRSLVVLYLLFLFSVELRADERFGKIGIYSVETNYQFGKIIAHNSRFGPKVTEFTHGFELCVARQTLGEKAWQRKMKYPEFGAVFMFLRHGNNDVFGNAYLLMASVKFWMVRSRVADFHIRLASGLGLAPRHYNVVDNPQNNVIGSTINSSIQIRLGLDWKVSPNVQITTSVSFSHYSNSGAQLPNLGINAPSASIGIRYFPVVKNDLSYNRNKWGKPFKKNEFGFKVGIGITEGGSPGGPKYPIYIVSANYARYTSIINKVLVGTTLEFDQGVHDGIILNEQNYKYGPVASSMRLGFFVGDEIMMGKVSMFFIAGAYAFRPVGKFGTFVKIGANYYFASVGKTKSTKFFVGTNIKTHYFVAQFYEMSAGIVF